MARTRSGLGQGLEALVSPREWKEPSSGGAPDQRPSPASAAVVAAGGPCWEYALVQRDRRRKRRLVIVSAHPTMAGATSRQRIRGLGLLGLLNALGGAGWELVAIRGRRLYLRRGRQRPS